MSPRRALTITLATGATIVGIVAFLLVPLSLVTGHPDRALVETFVVVAAVWYVARVMRADRRERRAAEERLPAERRPRRREPRRPITFRLRETAAAFAIWAVVVGAIGAATGLPAAVTIGAAIFAGFMLATLTVTGRHMMFRLTAEEDEPAGEGRE